MPESEPSPQSDAVDGSPTRDGAIHGKRPADGQDLEPVPVTAVEELGGVVARAREAGVRHAQRSVEDRAHLLRQLKDALLARGDRLARTLWEETGKPEPESWLHEILPTADLAHFWGTDGPSSLAAHEPELDALMYPGKRAVIERLPRGVVGLITPWNFPLALPLRTLFPALLAGNAVVLKPSEHAPRVASIIEEAAREVLDEGLVSVVHGEGHVGEALVGAGIDAVVFTGSVDTGRKVAHGAAEALVPASLELGGKDAAVVLEDADIERTARGVLWGAFANSGQNCAAIERVYAVSSVAERLRDRIAALAHELVAERDYGPIITEAQLERIAHHVDAARQQGAEVVTGGQQLSRDGRWYAPTVLWDTRSDSEVWTDETFGPVLPIVAVDSEEKAIEAANASRFGLTASVWTRDPNRGERVARQLRAGVVVVNNHGFTGAIPSLPWTGTGNSGYGVTNSPYALDTLTRPRTVVVDARRSKRELWWYPYTPSLRKLARALATLRRRGGGLIAKVRALGDLVSGLIRRWKP